MDSLVTQQQVRFFNAQQVRIFVDPDGTVWWVAKDVCDVLEIVESHRAIASLDDDEKGRQIVTTPGGPQEMACISEAGLYKLIMRSRKPAAKDFTRWVTHDVLPSIRQTGQYIQDKPVPVIDGLRKLNEELAAGVLVANQFGMVDNAALLSSNRAVLKMYGVDAMDLFGVTHLIQPEQARSLTVTEVGMELGLGGPHNVNLVLEQHGYQVQRRDHKQKLVWEMTDKGRVHGRLYEAGKTSGKGTPIMQLKWLDTILSALQDDIYNTGATT